MGVVWVSPSSSQRRLAHTPARERSDGSAAVRSTRRGIGFLSDGLSRRAFSAGPRLRTSFAGWRGLADSFASLSPALEHCSDGDAMSLADHERSRAALGHVVAAVRASHSSSGGGAGHEPARGIHAHP